MPRKSSKKNVRTEALKLLRSELESGIKEPIPNKPGNGDSTVGINDQGSDKWVDLVRLKDAIDELVRDLLGLNADGFPILTNKKLL